MAPSNILKLENCVMNKRTIKWFPFIYLLLLTTLWSTETPIFSILFGRNPNTQHLPPPLLRGYGSTRLPPLVKVPQVYFTSSTLRWTPSRAINVAPGTITTGTWVSGERTNRNFLRTFTNTSLISINANLIPMQFLGPPPNGMNWNGWRDCEAWPRNLRWKIVTP